MDRKAKLKKILEILSPDGTSVDFKQFDSEISKLKDNLKQKVQVQTLQDVNSQLAKFKKLIDFTSILNSSEEIKQTFENRFNETNNLLQQKFLELDQANQTSNGNVQNLEREIQELQTTLGIFQAQLANFDLITNRVEAIQSIQSKLVKFTDLTKTSLDSLTEADLKNEKEISKQVKSFQDNLETLKKELTNRINNIGGGSQNQRITINSSLLSTKYADFNLKAGTNIQLTKSDDDVNKRADITITAAASISGGIIGGADRAVVFIHPASTLSQDPVNFTWDYVNKQLQLGPATVFDGNPQETLTIANTYNNYTGIYVQNRSTGDSASTDIILGADNDSTAVAGHYLDLGVEGSGFVGASASLGFIKSVSINAAGSGYTAGDILTLVGGSNDAAVNVLTVNGSGVILTISINANGTNYVVASGLSTTGGTGLGATINVLTLFDLTLLSANDTYVWSSGGNLDIFTDDGTPGKVIKFAVGGTATGNEVARMTSSVLQLGNTGSIAGTLNLLGKTSGTTGVTVPSIAGAYNFVLPPNTGSSGNVLQTDGNGITTWTAAGGSGITRQASIVSISSTFGAVTKTDYAAFANVGIALTLPTAIGNLNLYTVKNVSTSSVIVLTTSAQTIDGSTTALLPAQNQSLDFLSDNANWNVI